MSDCGMRERHFRSTRVLCPKPYNSFAVPTFASLGIMGTIKSLEGDKQQTCMTVYTTFIPTVCDQISCGPVLNLSAVYAVVGKHIYPGPVHAAACGANLYCKHGHRSMNELLQQWGN